MSRILEDGAVRQAIVEFGRAVVARAIEARLDALRDLATRGDADGFEGALGDLLPAVLAACRSGASPSLRRVINATGVVIHTNLGRSPLPREAAEAVAAIAASYSNLEFDLDTGERGHRETHAERRLVAILGAEASVVVNNNAAAVLLSVNTFAEGREVMVSRGELVEIGGSFRIHEIVRKAGARLVEVGTTNRTRIADYAAALTAETGLILRVHPSNFRIVGFTESAALGELSELARERALPLVEDLGSGQLDPLPAPLDGEATLSRSLAGGATVVTASGDKLLGGPQAGFAVGARDAIARMRGNPLYRALRVDKMTIAALDRVLGLHEAGRRDAVPAQAMLAARREDVKARASRALERIERRRPGALLRVVDLDSMVGGGAAPDVALPSAGLALDAEDDALRFQALLRRRAVPVIARVADRSLVFDYRTVLPGEEGEVEEAIVSLLPRAREE